MCRYFDVEEKFVPLTNDCFVMTPEKMIEAIDENTIGELFRICSRKACHPKSAVVFVPVRCLLHHFMALHTMLHGSRNAFTKDMGFSSLIQ